MALNAGFVAVAAGRAATVAEGVAQARDALADGRGTALLARLVAATTPADKEAS